MDGHKFDALARSIGSIRSRRGVLGLVGGGALTGLGLRPATAKDVGTFDCRGERQTCDNDDECCGGNRTICKRISRDCDKRRLRRDDRCCGDKRAACVDSCDCCRPFSCVDNRCVRGNDDD